LKSSGGLFGTRI